jgi:hypothetical protein
MCSVLVMAMAVAGCATSGGAAAAKKGVSDEEGVKQALENWKAGMEGKDTTKLAAGISEKFSHAEWGNKQQMLGFLDEQFKQGTLDGLKIDASKAKVTIANGVATVYPVVMSASFGEPTIEFKLQKEDDGVWRATTINVEGI